MSKSWRPEGWTKSLRCSNCAFIEDYPRCQDYYYCEENYEAGADAMLEILTNKPYKVIEWECPLCGSERLDCGNCSMNRKHSPIPDDEEANGNKD
jgi:hypothetical protein